MKRREFYFQYHINRDCNLRCSHCYQDNYGRDRLSSQDLFKIAEHIVSAAQRWDVLARVALTGGEPLMSRSFWQLIEFFEQSDAVGTLTILTNGTLVGLTEAQRIATFAKLREVQISLDGATPGVHDSIRGKGTFEQALKGVRELKRVGVPVAIMFTLTNDNASEAIDILELAQRECVDYVTVERVVPCRTSGKEIGLIPSQRLREIYFAIDQWANKQSPHHHKVHVRRRRPLWALVSKSAGGFCPVGLSSLAILDDGTILPCRRLEIPIGNVLTDNGLFKAWYTSDLLWQVRTKTRLSKQCRLCHNFNRCGGCRAIAYAITGDYLGGDPQCWLN